MIKVDTNATSNMAILLDHVIDIYRQKSIKSGARKTDLAT